MIMITMNVAVDDDVDDNDVDDDDDHRDYIGDSSGITVNVKVAKILVVS